MFYLGFHSFRVRGAIKNYPPPRECLMKEIKRAFVEEVVNGVVGGVRLVSFSFSPP